jgi:uncharacterized membrane protein
LGAPPRKWSDTTKGAALTLAGFFALWIVALWIPKVLTHPAVEGNWLGVGEDLTLVVGAWLIYRAASSVPGCSATPVRMARALFGLALVPIGLSHFFYLKDAAGFIPAWMPFHVPLTMLSGAGHIAAKPADHQNWVNLLISSAETAAAWILAASYAGTVAPAPVAPRAPVSG